MKKLLAMMLMLASVFFIACEDDDDSTMSPEDAKTELSTLNTDMTGYLQLMTNSEGMEAIGVIMGLEDPFSVTTKSNGRTAVISNIEKFLLPVNPQNHTKNTFEPVPFDFNAHKGVYTFINEYPYWTVDLGGDVIEINFPSTEANQLTGTNDATLTIYNYEEVAVSMTDEFDYPYTDYMPTVILADLYIDEVKIVEIDLEATWITTGESAGEPTSFDISVYLTPFTFSGSFDHTATAASIDFDIKYNTEKIFAAGVNATFVTDVEDPITIGGYIQLLNVKMEATIDIAGMETVFESNTYTTVDEINAAINKEIDAVVYVDGVKAADILIEFVANEGLYSIPIEVAEDTYIYIDVLFKYSDGTTEQAAPYFAAFISGIDGLFDFFDTTYGG